jgi:hypothetical protein
MVHKFNRIPHTTKVHLLQAIVIFFGSISGVDLGKAIVKTPFSMDALMSSFCMSFVSTFIQSVFE